MKSTDALHRRRLGARAALLLALAACALAALGPSIAWARVLHPEVVLRISPNVVKAGETNVFTLEVVPEDRDFEDRPLPSEFTLSGDAAEGLSVERIDDSVAFDDYVDVVLNHAPTKVGTLTITVHPYAYAGDPWDWGEPTDDKLDGPWDTVSITVVPGDPAALGMRRQPVASDYNGSKLDQQPQVEIQDAYGNFCPGTTAEITAYRNSPGWEIGGDLTAVAQDGVATFTGITATKFSSLPNLKDGMIQFRAKGLAEVNSDTFTIPMNNWTPGTDVTVKAESTRIPSGGDPVVTIKASENFRANLNPQCFIVKPLQGVDITGIASVTGGGTDTATITLAGSTKVTGSFFITVRTVAFEHAGSIKGNDIGFAIVSGEPEALELEFQPAAPTENGGYLSTQPVVRIVDGNGHTCSSLGDVPITATVEGDGWELGGTTTVAARQGRAAFTDLTATNVGAEDLAGATIRFEANVGKGADALQVSSDPFAVPASAVEHDALLSGLTVNGNEPVSGFLSDPTGRADDPVQLGAQLPVNSQSFTISASFEAEAVRYSTESPAAAKDEGIALMSGQASDAIGTRADGGETEVYLYVQDGDLENYYTLTVNNPARNGAVISVTPDHVLYTNLANQNYTVKITGGAFVPELLTTENVSVSGIDGISIAGIGGTGDGQFNFALSGQASGGGTLTVTIGQAAIAGADGPVALSIAATVPPAGTPVKPTGNTPAWTWSVNGKQVGSGVGTPEELVEAICSAVPGTEFDVTLPTGGPVIAFVPLKPIPEGVTVKGMVIGFPEAADVGWTVTAYEPETGLFTINAVTENDYDFSGWYADETPVHADTRWVVRMNGADVPAASEEYESVEPGAYVADWADYVIDLPTTVTVHRLFNQWNQQRLYTTDENEVSVLRGQGWTDEGPCWESPATGTGDYTVVRLYNKYNDSHYYLRKDDTEQLDHLLDLGWQADSELAWFDSMPAGSGCQVYALYNPYSETDTHLWTPDLHEADTLLPLGWELNDTTIWAADLPAKG